MVHRTTLIRFVAPLVAAGFLAFGAGAIAADAEVAVATAPSRAAAGRAPAAPAPRVAPQAGPENSSPNSQLGQQWGLVNGSMVNVRMGPGIDHSVVTTLKGGDFVQIQGSGEGEKAGWLKIAWPEHSAVWIAKEGVQTSAASAGVEQTATVKVPAPVRASATRKSDPLCKLESGAKVVVLEELNGWLKIKPPAELHAFISAKYVTTGVRKPEAEKPPAANAVATQIPTQDKQDKQDKLVAASAPVKLPADMAKSSAQAATAALNEKQKDAEQKQKIADLKHDQELEATHKAAESKLRAEQDEQRKVADTKRQQEIESARIALETKRKAEEEEQRKIAEAKHEQDLLLAQLAVEWNRKVEEEQHHKIAEAKRQELETVRIALETKRKAEEEEQHKIADAKRLQELETARLAAESKGKADEAEKARKTAESQKKADQETARNVASASIKDQVNTQRAKLAPKKAAGPVIEEDESPRQVTMSSAYGAFSDPDSEPSKPAPMVEQKAEQEPAIEAKPSSQAAPLPEPMFSSTPAPVKSQAAVAPKAEYVATPVSTREPIRGDAANAKSKFVLPSHTPGEPSGRAEVVEFQEAAKPAPASEAVQASPPANPAVETHAVAPVKAPPTKPATIYYYQPAQTETTTTRR